jgi:hypothetical protein
MCSYRLLTSNRARADRLDVRFTPQLMIWGGAAEDFEEIRDIPERMEVPPILARIMQHRLADVV